MVLVRNIIFNNKNVFISKDSVYYDNLFYEIVVIYFWGEEEGEKNFLEWLCF